MAEDTDSEKVLRLTGGHGIAGRAGDERSWNTKLLYSCNDRY